VTRALASPHPFEEHVTNVRPMLLRLAACATLPLAAACGGDETQGTEDHTPVSYTVLVDGTETAPPLTLTQGQTVRVRLKFANAAGDDLDDVEAEHFGALVLEPAELGAVARLTDHHFQFDVTGGAPGTGSAQVSYGHDEAADETTLEPFDVTVQAAP
jgi:hypothetical protein